MAAPAGLIVKSKIEDMVIGDCIPCRYRAESGATGAFSELGSCSATEIPVTGVTAPDGLFYFIKSDIGLMIADRIIQTSVSWDVLNAAKFIQGKPLGFSVIPLLTSPLSMYPVNITASSFLGSGNESWRAFSGTAGGWVADGTTGWLKLDFGDEGKIITSYNLETNTPGQGAKNWTLEGSNNDSSWTVLDTRTNIVWGYTQQSFSFLNTTRFRYYRMNITANNGNIFLRVARMGLMESTNFLVRSLTGGVSYLSAIGGSSIVDNRLGMWPTENEWFTYITNGTLDGKIVAANDNVWHLWKAGRAWCQDTPILAISGASNRTANGSYASGVYGYGGEKFLYTVASNTADTTVGFRPVLEYPESIKQTNVWY